jgi:serine acetyltransferase
MSNVQESSRNFCALAKIVAADYPYDLIEFFNGAKPDQPESDLQSEVFSIFQGVCRSLISQHSRILNAFYSKLGVGYLDLKYLDHYLILCLRFAADLAKEAPLVGLADAVYYSSRIRTSSDIFYRSDIGECFMPTHPIGTCLDSHATYGVGLRLFNGVHIGPNKFLGVDAKDMKHPKIGDGVILLANSSIYGKSILGNNVIVSQGSVIVDEAIPDNCIVIGQSPNLRALPNKNNNLSIFNI